MDRQGLERSWLGYSAARQIIRNLKRKIIMSFQYTIDTDTDYEVQKYLDNKMFEKVYAHKSYFSMKKNHYEFVKLFDDAEEVFSTSYSVIIFYSDFCLKFHDWDRGAPNHKAAYKYSCEIVGKRIDLDFVTQKLKSITVPDTDFISWAFNTSQGIKTIETTVKYNGEVKNEFYPFIENAKEFMDDYAASKSTVLILNGHRGTGKSTLISDFIVRHKLKSLTTYDNNLMKEDGFFIKFLTEEYDLLVLEDADILLKSRVETNNETMAKLLNVSDGLVDMSKKKIIITANMENKSEIDPAIMRPGRCYDVVDFRKLHGSEIDKACEAMGRALPGPEKEYSLAECFNHVEEVHQKKFGF